MSRTGKLAWSYVACYTLWLLTAALGVLDLAVARVWLHEGYVLLGLNPWGFAAARNFGLIIFAVLWIAGTFYAESYYRDGVVKSRLLRRFTVITAVQLAPLVLTGALMLYRRLGS